MELILWWEQQSTCKGEKMLLKVKGWKSEKVKKWLLKVKGWKDERVKKWLLKVKRWKGEKMANATYSFGLTP